MAFNCNPNQTAWSEAEDAKVNLDWGTRSAQKISDDMPGRSRNAVIGRAHRLGLSKLKTGYSPATHNYPKTRKLKSERAPQALQVVQDRQKPEPAPIQPKQPVTAARGPVPFVEACGCRWPWWSSDALPSQKFVCGISRKHGDPYCREHMAVAYQPARPERPARPGRIMWAAE